MAMPFRDEVRETGDINNINTQRQDFNQGASRGEVHFVLEIRVSQVQYRVWGPQSCICSIGLLPNAVKSNPVEKCYRKKQTPWS
jgi:hypothetical protein